MISECELSVIHRGVELNPNLWNEQLFFGELVIRLAITQAVSNYTQYAGGGAAEMKTADKSASGELHDAMFSSNSPRWKRKHLRRDNGYASRLYEYALGQKSGMQRSFLLGFGVTADVNRPFKEVHLSRCCKEQGNNHLQYDLLALCSLDHVATHRAAENHANTTRTVSSSRRVRIHLTEEKSRYALPNLLYILSRGSGNEN